MRAHELVNVLNHVDGQSEWDGGDLLRLPDGGIISISESAKTMRPGESQLMPPADDESATSDDAATEADMRASDDPLPPFGYVKIQARQESI